jgi:glutamate-ammonia-ligase adenylyltransferase
MTVASDLDLIFVYGDTLAEASDGPKPLAPMVYFARLSQRLITALTAPTSEGKLYDVDMRLRPSGNQGPIASALSGFRKYQESDAWTWEHMALTRARPIAGPPALRQAIAAMIRDVLARPRDADKLLLDVAAMRARMAREFRARDMFDVKHARGGLVDCDFIAQYLQLRHAHDAPAVLDANTCAAFKKLAKLRLLDHAMAEDLIEATALWHRVQGLLRLTVGTASVRDAPVGVRRALALAGRVGDLEELEARMRVLAGKVMAQFEALVDKPAAAIRAARPASKRKEDEEEGE